MSPVTVATGGEVATAQGMLVGYRAADDQASLAETLGPAQAFRSFYPPGTNPTTFDVARSAPGNYGTAWPSFKDPPGPWVTDVARSSPPNTHMAWWHEVEGDMPAADYLRQFADFARRVRAAGRPDVKVVSIHAGSRYLTPGEPGYAGEFIPPAGPDAPDVSTIDLYQTGGGSGPGQVQRPVQEDPRFVRWRSLLPAGRRWGVTEWASGLVDPARPGQAARDAARIDAIQRSAPWLHANGCYVWHLWYTADSPGNPYRFSDAASQAAWRAVRRG